MGLQQSRRRSVEIRAQEGAVKNRPLGLSADPACGTAQCPYLPEHPASCIGHLALDHTLSRLVSGNLSRFVTRCRRLSRLVAACRGLSRINGPKKIKIF